MTIYSYLRHCLLLLLFILALPAQAAYIFNPALQWQTLSTPHFHIHFHDGLESTAREAATLLEASYDKLTVRLNWVPKHATHVVLSDRVDITNGWARSFPYNLMTLYLTPPQSDSSLAEFDNWLRVLIEHEYTHILHLDKAYGLPADFRKVLGRFPLLMPNMYQPPWILEGLATYIETDKARKIGRGQGSFFEALMRIEMEAGLKPLSQVNLPISSWPGGTTRYLYGVYFFQFLAEKYGEQQILALVNEYSDNLLPFFLNRTSGQIFGKSFKQLWDEFDIYLLEQFSTKNSRIRSQPLVAGEQLTEDGFSTRRPQFDGQQNLYFLKNDARSHNRLMRWRAGDKQASTLLETAAHHFDLHPTQGILLSKRELHQNTDLFADIYLFDPVQQQQRRLTHGGRYLEAIWSHDGQSILALHNQHRRSAIHRLDLNGQFIEVLWQGGEDEIIAHIDLSPDGQRMVASRWLPDSRWELALFSVGSKQWLRLTHTAESESFPQFHRDGNRVTFSADYQGVFNLHTLDLDDQSLTTHSHLFGAGLSPALDEASQQLVYVGYHATGSDLYRLPLDSALETATPAANQLYTPTPVPPYTGEPRPYSPLSSLLPSWWFPILESGANERFGFMTLNFDALQRHQYSLLAAYDSKRDKYIGSLDYLYDVWWPTIKFNLSRLPVRLQDSSGTIFYERQYDQLAAEVILPLLREEQQWHFHLGASQEEEYEIERTVGLPASPTLTEGLLGLGISFNSADYYSHAITQKDGRQIIFTAEEGSTLNGDHPGDSYKLDWREFIAINKQHTLAWRVVGAKSDATRREYLLGGESGQFELPLAQAGIARPLNGIFNQRRFPLRGYPEGLAALSGHQMALTHLEWRFPLFTSERSTMAPPLGVGKWSATVFYNSGAAWEEGETPQFKEGAGVEIGVDVIAGYNLSLPYRLGYAKGFQQGGEESVYITVGKSF